MPTRIRLTVLLCASFASCHPMSVHGQTQAPPAAKEAQQAEPEKGGADTGAGDRPLSESEKIEIADEPRTVDPATLVAAPLAKRVTVEYTDWSIREIAQWITEQQTLPVVIDFAALSDEGIYGDEPLQDSLSDAPLYLLLNRLETHQLGWYTQDEIVHITTLVEASEQRKTLPYNVGGLFDSGYEPEALIDAIEMATAGSWQDGEGGVELLGDVLFIRENDQTHHEVAGLLAALEKPARRTFTFDPPEHETIRDQLLKPIDVDFNQTSLSAAVEALAKQTGLDIRLDEPALNDVGIRSRTPVSLKLSSRSLSTVLAVMLAEIDLTYVLKNGALWVTTRAEAEGLFKSAVFDVRDLCRDEQESYELINAIQSQTSGPWLDVDGDGGVIVFAKTGTMVLRHTEQNLQAVTELLERYRTALKMSKPRPRNIIDPNEIVPRYYRMNTETADDLVRLLPELVAPDTWKSEQKPDAKAYIVKSASAPEVTASGSKGDAANAAGAVLIPQSVLIVHQTRKLHDEVAEVIHRVQFGDAANMGGKFFGGGMGGGGMGGGGFGGGFFSTPDRTTPHSKSSPRSSHRSQRRSR